MSEQIKFYTDAHIPKQIALQLRKAGVDIVRCEEVGRKYDSDEDHLAYAIAEGRTVIS